jgi:Mg-chelatase subunit ChlD
MAELALAERKETKLRDLLVTFILDESGSMDACKEATIKGFNEYVAKLQEEKTRKTQFTFSKFNSNKVEICHNETEINDIKELNKDNYVPNHGTPLYDAVGKTIKDTQTNDRDVICVIMTDGQENDSKEYTRDAIFSLIKEKEKDGWLFIFLGANIDSYDVSSTIGIATGNTANYTYDTVGTVYTCLAQGMRGYSGCSGHQGVSGYSAYNFFSAEDKSNLQGGTK